MPQPYEIRAGWRATFTAAVLQYAMRAGLPVKARPPLTKHTSDGENPIDLPTDSSYQAMIDHVLACLTGQADNLIEPASALRTRELTPEAHRHLTQPH
jgi:UDP-N-acetylglucosamine 3-dehydrogenase